MSASGHGAGRAASSCEKRSMKARRLIRPVSGSVEARTRKLTSSEVRRAISVFRRALSASMALRLRARLFLIAAQRDFRPEHAAGNQDGGDREARRRRPRIGAGPGLGAAQEHDGGGDGDAQGGPDDALPWRQEHDRNQGEREEPQGMAVLFAGIRNQVDDQRRVGCHPGTDYPGLECPRSSAI